MPQQTGIFYQNTSDINLIKDIVHKSGKMYLRPLVHTDRAVVNITTPATSTFTLNNPKLDGVAMADNGYNGFVLYFKDDNGKKAKVSIDASAGTAKTITFDAASALLVEDGTTAASLTNGSSYDLYVEGDKFYAGYTEFEFNMESNRETFMNDAGEPIREDIVDQALTLSGSFRNFSGRILAPVFNMSKYGSQVGKTSYAAGFDPAVIQQYGAEIETTDVNGNAVKMVIIRSSIKPNGAITLGSKSYKMIPFTMSAFTDSIGDSSEVNAFYLETV